MKVRFVVVGLGFATSACAVQSSTQATGDASLAYECGNRFRAQTSATNPIVYKWRAVGTHDSGVVFLGRHRSGYVQVSAAFTTRTQETATLLSPDGRVVARTANGNRPCAAAVVRGIAPDSIATRLWNALIADSNIVRDSDGVRLVHNALYLAFIDAASAEMRANAVAAVHGEILGGVKLGPLGNFIVRIPYQLDSPADSVSGPVARARALLEAQRGVRVSSTIILDSGHRP